MGLKSSLPAALKYQALIVENAARAAGLDSFDVVFELLSAADVNGIASYGGFPVRYPSWRFGMEYERLEKGYRWGLSKIYELVINNDPTYAYLVSSNSPLEQKLVMAHVYGHGDFFKHNAWFASSNRHMLDAMGSHATRIRRAIDSHGQERVETLIDRVLSLDTLIDPYLPMREHQQRQRQHEARQPLSERALRSLENFTETPLVRGRRAVPAAAPQAPHTDLPTADVLGFLVAYAPLEDWEREIVRLLRREAYYFAPQRMTKVINEGWASFWHSRLLTGGLLEPSELVDYADCHSAATCAPPGRFNPYKLGIELFRQAEARGESLFALRQVHNDVSLFDALSDEEFSTRFLIPLYRSPAGPAATAAAVQAAEPLAGEALTWQDAKARLLTELSWGGLPRIEVESQDADGRNELLLVHRHEGRDLDLAKAQDTLKHLGALWRAPVELLTIAAGSGRRLCCVDGQLSVLETGEALRRCRPEGGAAPQPPAPHKAG